MLQKRSGQGAIFMHAQFLVVAVVVVLRKQSQPRPLPSQTNDWPILEHGLRALRPTIAPLSNTKRYLLGMHRYVSPCLYFEAYHLLVTGFGS